MDICLNGYSDYVSQPQQESPEPAGAPLLSDDENTLEPVQAGFLPKFISNRLVPPQFDYNSPFCELVGLAHGMAVMLEAGSPVALTTALTSSSEKGAYELAVLSLIMLSVGEVARRFALERLEQFCSGPRGGRRQEEKEKLFLPEPELIPIRVPARRIPIEIPEPSFWQTATIALIMTAQQLSQLNQAATETAAGAAAAVGGALFIMPLNSSLLEFHNPDFDPI